jgi:hypothetical protein
MSFKIIAMIVVIALLVIAESVESVAEDVVVDAAAEEIVMPAQTGIAPQGLCKHFKAHQRRYKSSYATAATPRRRFIKAGEAIAVIPNTGMRPTGQKTQVPRRNGALLPAEMRDGMLVPVVPLEKQIPGQNQPETGKPRATLNLRERRVTRKRRNMRRRRMRAR